MEKKKIAYFVIPSHQVAMRGIRSEEADYAGRLEEKTRLTAMRSSREESETYVEIKFNKNQLHITVGAKNIVLNAKPAVYNNRCTEVSKEQYKFFFWHFG